MATTGFSGYTSANTNRMLEANRLALEELRIQYSPDVVAFDGAAFSEGASITPKAGKKLLMAVKKTIRPYQAANKVTITKADAAQKLAEQAGMTKIAKQISVEATRMVAEERVFGAGYKKKVTAAQMKKWKQSLPFGLQAKFTTVEALTAIPPKAAMTAIAKAQSTGLFEKIQVLSLVRVPDPIAFGRIEGSDDFYYITQWDDDVKVEDILAA